MFKTILQAVSILILMCFFGCQLRPTFTAKYNPDSEKILGEPIKGALAVTRFVDSRPPKLYTSTGKIFMTYIPILPYVSLPYERMDENVREISEDIEKNGGGITLFGGLGPAPKYEEYTYPLSFARTIAEDINASGLFKEVVFIDDDVISDSDKYPYQLSGRIYESPFRKTVTSYGLGMAGVLLWFLPIPMEKITGEVTLELTLTETKNQKVIWSKKIESEVTRYINLYQTSAMVYGRHGAFSLNVEQLPGDSQVDYRSLFGWNFEALRRGISSAKPELADSLKKIQ